MADQVVTDMEDALQKVEQLFAKNSAGTLSELEQLAFEMLLKLLEKL